MAEHMAVAPRVVRPGPRNSRVETTLTMTYTVNLAARMQDGSTLRNWRVPTTQLPTNETVTLLPPTSPPRRQGPPHSYIAGVAAQIIKYLTATMVLALIVWSVFVLVWRQAIGIMSWRNADEADEAGNKQLQTKPVEKADRSKQSGKCVLPAYPENGKYVITNAPDATPGDSFESLKLTVNCLPGYGVLGIKILFCLDGLWSNTIAQCVRFCKLDKNPSVTYHCLVTGPVEGTRACNASEPSGTVVRPECNSPNYNSDDALPFMRCIDGKWDNVPVCSPECGRVTPNGATLMMGGKPAKRGELPWHVGIYTKNEKPYMQICGGSLISSSRVISAAHCFWKDDTKQLPASQFAVAAGKIYRPWNNPRDVYAQKSDVKEIKIPARFQGEAAHFQEDIAVLILETAFVYTLFVSPICLSFNYNFDTSQLQPGKLGKVAGWGLTAKNGKASQILKVVDLPYVDIHKCIATYPPSFRAYINGDKFCAGYGNGITALCRGDSGGGLAFAESERGAVRYYLRGIASTAPTNEDLCNSNTVTTFTHILVHEHFVRENL